MQAGKSYVVKIKLKPNYTYLMSDGTTGHFKDTTFGGGTQTPIGVVADPTARVAIALKNAGEGTKYEWTTSYSHGGNTTVYSPIETGLTDMEGYKWTWETAGTTDGTIKANQQTAYPAFYAAGHYNPGVTVSGTLVGKKWYLPSLGELYAYGGKKLGFAEDTDLTTFYGIMVDEGITKVGGTKLTNFGLVYMVSTQVAISRPSLPAIYMFSFYYTGGIGWSGGNSLGYKGFVRPFIKY